MAETVISLSTEEVERMLKSGEMKIISAPGDVEYAEPDPGIEVVSYTDGQAKDKDAEPPYQIMSNSRGYEVVKKQFPIFIEKNEIIKIIRENDRINSSNYFKKEYIPLNLEQKKEIHLTQMDFKKGAVEEIIERYYPSENYASFLKFTDSKTGLYPKNRGK